MKRIFSIFKVYDYKGEELSATTNVSLNDVVCDLLESGIIEHKEIKYSDDLYEKSDSEIIRICNESTLSDNIYAGGGNPIIKVYEHMKKRELVEIDLNEFKKLFANYIIKNK